METRAIDDGPLIKTFCFVSKIQEKNETYMIK